MRSLTKSVQNNVFKMNVLWYDIGKGKDVNCYDYVFQMS